ncbi:hypothetical protein DPMN_119203 [Dreissena polymorpha]|uniref:Uncharacterized protein n=1 Tax=Dreissena polymorpha TaxID=45954 RepID=A0A9D4GLF9_DREPO|nr:hypothetical protein DPMN_119203 [Dreissena polymorpha]
MINVHMYVRQHKTSNWRMRLSKTTILKKFLRSGTGYNMESRDTPPKQSFTNEVPVSFVLQKHLNNPIYVQTAHTSTCTVKW